MILAPWRTSRSKGLVALAFVVLAGTAVAQERAPSPTKQPPTTNSPTVPPTTTLAAATLSETTLSDGVFTEVQAERGRKAYLANCASCHTESHNGGRFFHGEPVPVLRRDALLAGWPDLRMYFEWLREQMPADAPMALTGNEYIDILTYLLAVNGYPAGARELPADPRQLQRIRIQRGVR